VDALWLKAVDGPCLHACRQVAAPAAVAAQHRQETRPSKRLSP
jgi:hypothetical protein